MSLKVPQLFCKLIETDVMESPGFTVLPGTDILPTLKSLLTQVIFLFFFFLCFTL